MTHYGDYIYDRITENNVSAKDEIKQLIESMNKKDIDFMLKIAKNLKRIKKLIKAAREL